jgi:antitoxin component HigA of HigAB toxin-antitoxin module
MRKLKYNIEFFKNLAIEKDGNCLSIDYVNSKTKLEFMCKYGHTWKTLPRNIISSNTWCPICSGHVKLTIEEMQKIAKNKEGKCLSKIYINANINLLWKCKFGHKWLANANRIKNSNDWCPICSKNKKLTIEEMQKIATKREGKCISEKYINCDTKLLWKCKEGHQWMALPKSIKYDNNWCPIYNESLNESVINNYLKQNNILFEREKKI